MGQVGVEEGGKKLREFEREVQNDPLQNEKPKMKESQKGKTRKAEDSSGREQSPMRGNLHRMLYALGCQTQSAATILLRRAAAAVAEKMVTNNIASKTVVTIG